MTSHLRNQSGATILQGLLLASILAGAALVGTRIISTQKLSLKGAETKDNVEQINDLVYSVLQHKEHCRATLAANGITLGSPYPWNLNRIVTSAGSPVVEVYGASFNLTRRYMNGSVVVKRIRVLPPGPPPAPGAIAPATLEIAYERLNSGEATRTKVGMGGKDLRRVIPLVVQSVSPISCYAADPQSQGNRDLVKEFCENLGQDDGIPDATPDSLYIWDPVTNTCKFRHNQCGPGQIFTGINSSGKASCLTPQNVIDLNQFLDTTSSNCQPGMRARLQQVGSRVRIVCTAPPATSCSPMVATWSAGGFSCSANLGSGSNGASQTVTDSTSPHIGSATFSCSSGTWSGPTGATCNNTPPSCPAATMPWVVAGNTCSGALPARPSGATASATSSSPVGAANFICNSGSWVTLSGATCSGPSGCPAGPITWSSGGNTCSANLPTGASGATASATSSSPAGTATYLCNGSNWTIQGTPSCGSSPLHNCTRTASALPTGGSLDISFCLPFGKPATTPSFVCQCTVVCPAGAPYDCTCTGNAPECI